MERSGRSQGNAGTAAATSDDTLSAPGTDSPAAQLPQGEEKGREGASERAGRAGDSEALSAAAARAGRARRARFPGGRPCLARYPPYEAHPGSPGRAPGRPCA